MSQELRPGSSTLFAAIKGAARLRPLHKSARSTLQILRAADLIPRHVEGTVNGRTIVLDLNEMVDQKVALFGAFDQRGLGLIHRVMQAIGCRTAVDVGANIGNHTAFFSEWARRVIAIEPNPPVFARLQRFIAENALLNVVPVEAGLSDRAGELALYLAHDQAHLATLEPNIFAGDPVKIKIERGDDLMRRLGVEDADFIKIDVEGHEREVLAGLKDTMTRQRPFMTVEFTSRTCEKFGSPQAFLAAFPGYELYGTRISLSSRVFKSALSLESFDFGKDYTHVLCVPKERAGEIASLTKGVTNGRHTS
jgi:FkbM family methyltransferase